MKRLLATLFVLATGLSGAAQTGAAEPQATEPSRGGGTLRVATLNVHYIAEEGDYGVPWEPRRRAVAESIRRANPDIVAFQEMETFAGSSWSRQNRQQAYLARQFPEYHWGATGTPPEFPNTQPVMYRSDRFAENDRGFFFFSESPDVPYSDPWVGRFSAFATWTLLSDNSPAGTPRLYVYNVHFDSRHGENRRRAAQLVLERIRSRRFRELPVIVLGDFNAPRFFPPVRVFREAGFQATDPGGATFHFNRGLDLLPGIDHILASSELDILETNVDRRRYGGVWPSDHYMVTAELSPRKTAD